MIRLSTAIAFAAIGLAASSASAYTETPPFRWKEGFFRFTSLASYSTTTANFVDTRNSTQNLTSGNSFTEETVRLRGRYNWSDYISTYVSSDIANAQANDTVYGNRSDLAVTDGQVGIDVALLRDSWRLVAELEGSYCFDQASYTRTAPLGSDGVNDGKFTLYLFKSLGWLNLLASGGGEYRDQGLSTLALWSVALEKPLFRNFLLGLGADGFESVIGDQQTEALRQTLTTQADAGSLRNYANTPGLSEGGAWIGFAPISSIQMRLGYEQAFAGIRTAYGGQAFFAFSWNFEPRADPEGFTTSEYSRRREREERRGREATKAFRVEDEKTDDSLFYEDDAPKKPPPPQQPSDPLGDAERRLDHP